jgi:hypothetical protein
MQEFLLWFNYVYTYWWKNSEFASGDSTGRQPWKLMSLDAIRGRYCHRTTASYDMNFM